MQVKQKDISSSVVGTLNQGGYEDHTGPNTDFYNGSYKDTDGATGFETSYMSEWSKWHGYYEDVDIFAAVIDVLALWTVGKGYKADEATIEKLNRIRGFGKDDFNSIIENLVRTMLINGDSFAEIIKDKAGRITNLKPINPGTIKIIANESGIIERYEQWLNGNKIGEDYDPKKIFHLCWNRLADEIHGKPMAKREEATIKQMKQLIEDLGLRFHRIVKPLRLFEAETDNETKLLEIESKLANGYKNCEVIVIPKGTLEEKDGATMPNAQDAIEYLNSLMRKFVTSVNCPEVILGWSTGSTDASAKIVYLSFQQPTERKQKFLEEQIKNQLGLELNFEFPASLEPEATKPVQNNSPVNNPVTEDEKQEGKLNNIMKK